MIRAHNDPSNPVAGQGNLTLAPDTPRDQQFGPMPWMEIYKRLKQQYPLMPDTDLMRAAQAKWQEISASQKADFNQNYGPKTPMSEDDLLRQLIGEARKKMEFDLKKQAAMDQLKAEFGQKRDSQKQDQEVLNSGRKWRWNGTNYVYDDTDDIQAAQDELNRKRRQEKSDRAAPVPQDSGKLPPRSPASSFKSLYPAKPGQAQPIQPQSQGTKYGEFLNDPPGTVRHANWVDIDGDGIDDRYQSGPGRPRALPPGVRPNPIGGKGN